MTKLERISSAVKAAGMDAAVIISGAEWAAGFRGNNGNFALVLASGEGFIISSPLNFEQISIGAEPLGYKMIRTENGCFNKLGEIVKEYGIKVLGYEDAIGIGDYKAIEKCGAEMVSVGDMIRNLMGVKDEKTVLNILSAQTIAEKALYATLPMIRPGVSERDIAAELNYHMAKLGSEGPAFGTIIVSGPNSSLPHGKPSERMLRCGDFLTIDFGATVNGDTSDMTRTFAIGYATDKMKFIYDTVLKAQLAAIEAFVPGSVGCDVHNVSHAVIEAAGYGPNYIHSLGHSMKGGPNASRSSKDVFEIGNVVTMEPGIYIPGYGGVRIEDMVWLSPDGPVNLTHFPKELQIL